MEFNEIWSFIDLNSKDTEMVSMAAILIKYGLSLVYPELVSLSIIHNYVLLVILGQTLAFCILFEFKVLDYCQMHQTLSFIDR